MNTQKKQTTPKPNSRPASGSIHGRAVQSAQPSKGTDSRSAQKSTKTGRRRTERKKQRQQQIVLRILLSFLVLVFLILSGSILGRMMQEQKDRGQSQGQGAGEDEGKIPRPPLDVDLLTVNEYSRPGIALKKVKGVVIHYTGNPGTGAAANRNYFEGLKDSHATKASSHFVIGLRGEIIQCIPSSEISYASNERNKDTVSIECCIRDKSGRFEKATYDSAVHLTAWLVEHFGLETEDVIRHYDVTGKACPKYFVDFPSAWEQFLADVQAYLISYGVF